MFNKIVDSNTALSRLNDNCVIFLEGKVGMRDENIQIMKR